MLSRGRVTSSGFLTGFSAPGGSRSAEDPSPAVKLAVVGGGSTYTPELVAGLGGDGGRPAWPEVVRPASAVDGGGVEGAPANRSPERAGYTGTLAATAGLAGRSTAPRSS